jgi:hypothetical protein
LRCLLLLALLASVPAAHAQSLLGALYVTTDPPETAVYVNGELKGVSPCGVQDVPVGQVEVRAEKQGFAAATETIQIQGDQTGRINLALRRLANVGSVAVLVDPPGSKVRIDRVPVGRTPLVVLNVAAGTHRIDVQADGFRPLQSTATVAANEQFILREKLTSASGAASDSQAAVDLADLGKLDSDRVPPTSQLPQERLFEPVRSLLAQRQYADALRKLDAMASDEQMLSYSQRIGLLRRLARRAEEVTRCGTRQLGNAVGQEYVLMLRRGVQFNGTLVGVTDTQVLVRSAGQEHGFPLSDISAVQLVRLASRELDPEEPANRASFAVLLAADGEFDKAYEQLRAAAAKGGDISEARSYVDAERLWAAAVAKEQAERLLAQVSGRGTGARLDATTAPVQTTVDVYHGDRLPPEVERLLAGNGFVLRTLAQAFTSADGEGMSLLLLLDQGPDRAVPAYDPREVQVLLDFVRAGGGLVFAGASPPSGQRRPAPDPFAPLLRWCGMQPRTDKLSLSKNAPPGYPSDCLLCFPAVLHPVTYEVRRAVFPLSSPSLAADDASWVMMRASQFVLSKEIGQAAPAVVAARLLGKGRVVVFASLPVRTVSPWERSPYYANDADKLLLNAFRWAAGGGR